MKRYLIILTLNLCAVVPTMAQYYSVNYDKRTVEAMTAAFATEAATEAYYAEQVAKLSGGRGGSGRNLHIQVP